MTGGGIPWIRNGLLTLQTVRAEVRQDPARFALQASRRLPDAVTVPLARLLARTGAFAGGSIAAVGHQMLGDDDAVRRGLGSGARPGPGPRPEADARKGARGAAMLATAALGSDEPDVAGRLLAGVPPAQRTGAWSAAAARLSWYRGDLTAALALAGAHPRNRTLARLLEADRAVLAGYRPAPGSAGPLTPVPGRVLHVLNSSLPHTASGYAQRSQGALRALSAAGFEVHAVTRPGYPVEVGIPWARRRDVVDGVPYARLLPARLAAGATARLDQYARLLSAEVEVLRPAVLHTTTHFTNALVVDAVARAHAVPWVYEVRGQRADSWAATRDPASRESEYYREFTAREAEAARAADAVVTLGENMRQVLLDAGVAPERVHLCPNAVDEAFLAEPPATRTARARLGMEPEDVVVGTVSSIVDYEGLDLLVRAVARLAPRHPRLRLRIVGDGVSLPGLRVLAGRLGIADRCQFPGRVDRSQAVVNHAALDVFVVPRRDLPVTRAVTPMKTVEASAAGKPVLAADLPALAELVQDGTTGRLVAPDDDAALADALEELITDPALARRLGDAGRDWALSTRTWAQNATTYTRMYAGLGVAPGPVPRVAS